MPLVRIAYRENLNENYVSGVFKSAACYFSRFHDSGMLGKLESLLALLQREDHSTCFYCTDTSYT